MTSATTGRVVDLTNDIYEQFLNQSEIAVVAFYLPWLPNYQRFSKAFSEAITLINDPRIRYGQVDCTKEQALFQRYGGVPTWPAINLFKSPTEIVSLKRVYMGDLTARAISSWIKRQISPVVTMLDRDTLISFKQASEVVVIGYMAQNDDFSNQIFQAVAEPLHSEYLFGIVHDEVLARQEHVNMPGIVVYKDFDEGENVLDSIANIDDVANFVKNSAVPLVIEFLPETPRNSQNRQTPLGYFLVGAPELAHLRKGIARSLAMKYRNKIQLGVADIEINSNLPEKLHADIESTPSFAIADTIKNLHYPLRDIAFSEDAVDTFIENFLDGKLKPVIRSAPIPESQGPLLEVVADTWNDLVINNDKDVLIEYYTPWCGPCKRLLPDLTKLAELYMADTNIRDKVAIGKIDGDANDLDSVVRGFPTFKLFPAGSKDSPIEFLEASTIQQWAKFVYEKGGNQVSIDLSE